jgi:hypothetical protein
MGSIACWPQVQPSCTSACAHDAHDESSGSSMCLGDSFPASPIPPPHICTARDEGTQLFSIVCALARWRPTFHPYRPHLAEWTVATRDLVGLPKTIQIGRIRGGSQFLSPLGGLPTLSSEANRAVYPRPIQVSQLPREVCW